MHPETDCISAQHEQHGCMLPTDRIFWASWTLSNLKLETPMA